VYHRNLVFLEHEEAEDQEEDQEDKENKFIILFLIKHIFYFV